MICGIFPENVKRLVGGQTKYTTQFAVHVYSLGIGNCELGAWNRMGGAAEKHRFGGVWLSWCRRFTILPLY